jgi:hypothetical protein
MANRPVHPDEVSPPRSSITPVTFHTEGEALLHFRHGDLSALLYKPKRVPRERVAKVQYPRNALVERRVAIARRETVLYRMSAGYPMPVSDRAALTPTTERYERAIQ